MVIFKAFTTTFEDLNGINQLPGLACQRLMNDGYGFGAEGDWKTAALVRSMKVIRELVSKVELRLWKIHIPFTAKRNRVCSGRAHA